MGALLLLLLACGSQDVPLFDGKSFAGWEGDTEKTWRVEEGTLAAGSPGKAAPRNEFLSTTREFENFDLRLKFKVTGTHRVNAGVQFRTKRIPNHHEVSGYQADIGPGVAGMLYDESRRRRTLARPDGATRKKAQEAVGKDGWNTYRILAEGPRIRLWLNGVLTVDYTEKEEGIDRKGIVALQIHGGMKAVIAYKDIVIRELKESPVKPPSKSGWRERIEAVDPGSQGEAWAKLDFGSEDWAKMELPTHWEDAGLPDRDGVVWFRKQIAMPGSVAGMTAVLTLGPVDDMDVTWINGIRVGGYEEPGAHDTPRRYDVPSGVLRQGKNVIVVRVMDHGWPGGFGGKAEQMALTVGGGRIELAGTWRYRPGADLPTLKRAKPVTRRPVDRPPTPGFEGGFILEEGDVVAFAGGTEMFRQSEAGHLETLLTLASRGKRVRFRNIAWQADTVHVRQRPRNFGTQLDLLNRIGATVVIAAFGQMESMEGADRLPAFIQAYGRLLDEFARRTGRIVLVTPRPFGRPADLPAVPDLTRHNGSVKAYGAAIRVLAGERGYLCVDLSGVEAPTLEGLTLTAEGRVVVGRAIAARLLGDLSASMDEALRAEIVAKNRLWEQHWRPSNWSFAFGNRQHVPSSRDHVDPNRRWFPAEITSILGQIEKAERRIHGQ